MSSIIRCNQKEGEEAAGHICISWYSRGRDSDQPVSITTNGLEHLYRIVISNTYSIARVIKTHRLRLELLDGFLAKRILAVCRSPV